MAVRLVIRGSRSRFFIRQIRDRMDRAARQSAEETAEQLLRDIQANITRASSPPASRPGEFPHTATGELARSGRVEKMHGDDGEYAAVVFDAKHAPYVESMRPFMSRTAEETEPEIAQSLTRRILRMFGRWF